MKTTLLRELADYVQSRNEQAFYFSLENPILLIHLNENPENIFSYIPKNKRIKYLFLDEVQYLYDTYAETIKLIVSGSSAFYVDRSFRDSIAGRKRIIELYSFSEFLRAKGEKDLAEQIGSLFNADELGNIVGLSTETVRDYTYLLRKSFIFTDNGMATRDISAHSHDIYC